MKKRSQKKQISESSGSDFDRQYNVSFLDESLPQQASVEQVFRHLGASVLVYGTALLIFAVSPWYRDLLQIQFHGYSAYKCYWVGFVAYLLIAPIILLTLRPRSLWVSKNIQIVNYFGRVLKRVVGKKDPELGLKPSYPEQQSLAFLLIKLFYGPLMICSTLTEYNSLHNVLDYVLPEKVWLHYLDYAYMIFLRVIFLVDSIMYATSYHSETGLFRNKLRYAETKPFHIFVCLACYPPFNQPTTALFGMSNHDHYLLYFGQLEHPVTWVLRGLAVLCLLLLISADLSLFTRASNLTNRGIVTWGPYRLVRHPGYVGKQLFWLVTAIPAFIPNTALPQFTWLAYAQYMVILIWGIVGWCTMYVLRALTEERFLSKDPEYRAYCEKVRYRFIPGVI